MVKLEGLVSVCLSGNQTSRSRSHSRANSQLDVQPDLTMQSVSHLRDVGGGKVAIFYLHYSCVLQSLHTVSRPYVLNSDHTYV